MFKSLSAFSMSLPVVFLFAVVTAYAVPKLSFAEGPRELEELLLELEATALHAELGEITVLEAGEHGLFVLDPEFGLFVYPPQNPPNEPELPEGCIHKESGFACTGDSGKIHNMLEARRSARNKAKNYCASLNPPKRYVEDQIECKKSVEKTTIKSPSGRNDIEVEIVTWKCTTRGRCV